MSGESFVIVIDIPSIKKYVFGPDALNEVRGASAKLDRLNRETMEQHLCDALGAAHVERIYANGGSAQFLAHECDERAVKTACDGMGKHIREETGGEVRVVYGIASLENDSAYPEAVRMAHFRMRCHREFAASYRSPALRFPAVMACKSAPHLPAAHIQSNGTRDVTVLSKASYAKHQQGRETRRYGRWLEWMGYLESTGPWPAAEHWADLRCQTFTDIGTKSSRRNYIGIVYADGNAMGKVVKALNQPTQLRQFSRIVDESLREACFSALTHISASQVDTVREALHRNTNCFEPLAADILLLGGDDLLVAVPANHALNFALLVTERFEALTREKIANIPDAATRQFFRDALGDNGTFTISCGVAIAKSNYPFYLSLDLAEQLLKNAKRKENQYSHTELSDNTARIDFHVVAGANSYALQQVREKTYRAGNQATAPRTLRPLTCPQLEALRSSVSELRDAGFPRSKLHELQEAALAAAPHEADWRIRDIFARCQHGHNRSQRRALWHAVQQLCPDGYTFEFPWFQREDRRMLCLADVVEAYELF